MFVGCLGLLSNEFNRRLIVMCVTPYTLIYTCADNICTLRQWKSGLFHPAIFIHKSLFVWRPTSIQQFPLYSPHRSEFIGIECFVNTVFLYRTISTTYRYVTRHIIIVLYYTSNCSKQFTTFYPIKNLVNFSKRKKQTNICWTRMEVISNKIRSKVKIGRFMVSTKFYIPSSEMMRVRN